MGPITWDVESFLGGGNCSHHADFRGFWQNSEPSRTGLYTIISELEGYKIISKFRCINLKIPSEGKISVLKLGLEMKTFSFWNVLSPEGLQALGVVPQSRLMNRGDYNQFYLGTFQIQRFDFFSSPRSRRSCRAGSEVRASTYRAAPRKPWASSQSSPNGTSAREPRTPAAGQARCLEDSWQVLVVCDWKLAETGIFSAEYQGLDKSAFSNRKIFCRSILFQVQNSSQRRVIPQGATQWLAGIS